MTKPSNTKYDISEFLTHTLGAITKDYVLELAELTGIKEQQNKKLYSQLEQLHTQNKGLQHQLIQANESINTLNQQHQQILQTLRYQHSLALNQLEKRLSEIQKTINTKQPQQVIDPSVKIVTNTKTKLMWAVNTKRVDNFPNPNKPILWHQTDVYITAANKQNYGGFNDWRLPTKEELSSLLLPHSVNQWFIDTSLFFDTEWGNYGVYWSSSTKQINGILKPHIYVVNFSSGFAYTGTSEYPHQLRLVRSM
jgi:hypothetical protein